MQREITQRTPLLDKEGKLTMPGFAKKLLWDYRREDIKAPGFKIKEWDYYYIICEDFAIALTIADNSYMGLDSMSFISFKGTPWEITKSPMQFFTFGKKKLPPSSEAGSVSSSGKGYFISFEHLGDKRHLTFAMDGFMKGDIMLHCPETESMVIATPFEKAPLAFYYNQKINCMEAEGEVFLGDVKHTLTRGKAFAGLDWGRGVWTYKNTWYWGSASGAVDGIPFGFNIGYGFGDTSAATENMIFYNGKAHKIGNVTFNIPRQPKTFTTRGGCCGHGGMQFPTHETVDDFMSPWTFTSDDNRFEMYFEPIIDRASKTDFHILCSDQHQVFGRFTGKAVLDDGTVISIRDFLGFAEKVFNKW